LHGLFNPDYPVASNSLVENDLVPFYYRLLGEPDCGVTYSLVVTDYLLEDNYLGEPYYIVEPDCPGSLMSIHLFSLIHLL